MIERAWRIVRAELSYRRTMIIASYSVFIILALYFGLRRHEPGMSYSIGPSLSDEFTLLMWIAVAGHAFLTYRLITNQRHEQRLRFLLPLPLNRRDIGLGRLSTVLLIHATTFLLLFLWIAFFVNVREFDFSRRIFQSLSTFELKEIILWSILSMIAISICFSLFIMLLESRRRPPLFSTVQWGLFVFLLLLFLSSVIDYPSLAIPSRGLILSYRGRGGLWMFDPGRWGFLLIPTIPTFTVIALILGRWYWIRFRRQESYAE